MSYTLLRNHDDEIIYNHADEAIYAASDDPFRADARGKSAIRNPFASASRGVHATRIDPYEAATRGVHATRIDAYALAARGVAHVRNAFSSAARGVHATRIDYFTRDLRGVHATRIDPYDASSRGAAAIRNAFASAARGAAQVRNAFASASRGAHATRIDPYAAATRGTCAVYGTFASSSRGVHLVLQSFDKYLRGLSRVANDALSRHELYRGIDGDPDYTSDPWLTFSSLPHTTTALDPAPAGTERTYKFVLRLRNRWGLVSRNVETWSVTVDDTGAAVVDRPSAPDEVEVDPAAAGTVRVQAYYSYTADGDDAATQWLVYLSSDGSDPDPSADTPTAVSMTKADGIAKLDWTSSAFADGTTVKMLVRTRRVDAGPTNVDSTNTEIYSAVADTDGPTAPAGVVTFGSLAGQEQ